jgi:hypothetical protein
LHVADALVAAVAASHHRGQPRHPALAGRGHRLAIRQLSDGYEVGRVSWALRPAKR